MPNILVIAIPDLSFTNSASRTINFCSLGFTETFSFGKKGIDLFRKLSGSKFGYGMQAFTPHEVGFRHV